MFRAAVYNARMETSQHKILSYCLKNCIFDGWTEKLLADACENAGLEPNYHRVIFPFGVVDLIDFYVDETSDYVAKNLKTDGLRTHEKIREAVKLRLIKHSKDKEIIKLCLAVYAKHPLRGMSATYRVVDSMWRICGDTATDWNFYSKRALLAGVYSSTLLYWLNDNSDNNEATWKFLDSRLKNIAELGKAKKKIKELLGC